MILLENEATTPMSWAYAYVLRQAPKVTKPPFILWDHVSFQFSRGKLTLMQQKRNHIIWLTIQLAGGENSYPA